MTAKKKPPVDIFIRLFGLGAALINRGDNDSARIVADALAEITRLRRLAARRGKKK